MFTFSQREAPGLLKVKASGFWSCDEATRFEDQLAQNVASFRARHTSLRLLIDLTDFVVQSAGVVAQSEDFGRLVFSHPDDRVAFVVESALLKAQAARLHAHLPVKIFISVLEAEEWLLA